MVNDALEEFLLQPARAYPRLLPSVTAPSIAIQLDVVCLP
jgi:hypothetical protein